jgi:hypothetical protein
VDLGRFEAPKPHTLHGKPPIEVLVPVIGEERPVLDGLGSRPALFVLYYVKPNPLFL